MSSARSKSSSKRKVNAVYTGVLLSVKDLPSDLSSVCAVWKKSDTVSGTTNTVSVKNGSASFAEQEFSFEATIFTSSSRDALPEPSECEPKPLELQVVSQGKTLASARINLSEYLNASSWISLSSQLRSSVPNAPPITLRFRLRCAVSKVSPVRSMQKLPSSNALESPSPVTPLGRELGALGRRVVETPQSGRSDLNSSAGSMVNDSVLLNESQQQDDLRFEVARLKAALEAQSSELQQLGDEHEESQADVSRLKAALEEQSREFAAQQESLLSRLRETETRAEEREAKLKRAADEKDAELVEIGLSIQELEQRERVARERLEQQATEMRQRDEMLSKTKEQESSSLQAQLLEAQGEKAKLQVKIKEMENHQHLQQSRIDVLEVMSQRLESSCEKTATDLESSNALLRESQSKLALAEEALANRVRDMTQANMELQKQVDTLGRELSLAKHDAQSALENAKIHGETLQKSSANLESQVHERTKVADGLKKQLEDLTAQLAQSKAEGSKNLSEYKAEGERRAKLEAENAALLSRVEQMQKSLDESKNGAADLDKARKEEGEKRAKLEAELKHASDENASLKSRVEQMQKSLDESKNGAADLDKARTEEGEKRAKLEVELKHASDENASLKLRVEQMQKSLDESKNGAKEEGEKRAKLEAELKHASDENASLKSRVEQMQKSLDESKNGAADLDKARTEEGEKRAKLEVELKHASDENASLKLRVEQMQKSLDESKNGAKEEGEKRAKLEAELKHASDENASLKSRVEQMQKSLDESKNGAADLDKARTEEGEKRAKLEVELKHASDENASLKLRVEQMQKSLDESKNGAADLDKARKEEGEKRIVLETRVHEAEEHLAASTSRLKAAENALESERVRLRAAEAAVEELTKSKAANEAAAKRAGELSGQLDQARKRQQELAAALDLAKEQRAEERERAQELEARVEELATQLEQEHAAMRKKLEQAESRGAEAAKKAGEEALQLKRILEERTSEKVALERVSSQLKDRIETLEKAGHARDAQLVASESRTRDAVAERGKLLERVGELERALTSKDEKTSEQLASMKRDLDKQAEGKTERIVREIVERNVYLSSHREEFDKNNIPAASLRLLEELKDKESEVQLGVVKAASEFARAEGQSLSVIAHVAAVLLGLAKISPRSGALSRSCVAAVSESALPALVAAVLALWQKSAPGKKGSSGKSAAVPVQGAAVAAVWKQSLEAMLASRLPAPVITCLCGALAAQLDRFIFNQIVANSTFCTFACGFQLKMELSHLLDFMYAPQQAPYLKQHTNQLAHVTEVSSLLTISKDILTDRSILASAFPNLNPAQIRSVLASYVSEGPSDVIAPAVLQFFDKELRAKEHSVLLGPEAANQLLTQISNLV